MNHLLQFYRVKTDVKTWSPRREKTVDLVEKKNNFFPQLWRIGKWTTVSQPLLDEWANWNWSKNSDANDYGDYDNDWKGRGGEVACIESKTLNRGMFWPGFSRPSWLVQSRNLLLGWGPRADSTQQSNGIAVDRFHRKKKTWCHPYADRDPVGECVSPCSIGIILRRNEKKSCPTKSNLKKSAT